LSVDVDMQIASEAGSIPSLQDFSRWASAALDKQRQHAELVVRVVDEDESATLNQTYRNKQGPTNVLSFPFEIPEGVDVEMDLLGDLVICAPVVEMQAHEQGKAVQAHWAHMVVHGTLHLQGFDHLTDEEALVMESREKEILTGMGFQAPYETEQE